MDEKKRIMDILNSYKKNLTAKYKIKTFALFGSFTRAEFNSSSDIDILIDFDQPIGVEFIDIADELEELLGRKVDLVSKRGIKPKYFREIEKELMYV